MGLLLDTHIVLALVEKQTSALDRSMIAALVDPANAGWVSMASLWELAIKWRLGKLPLVVSLDQWPDALRGMGIELLPIHASHILADIGPEPSHKDPFDRLLLGVCAAEGLKLITVDRQLATHRLAWRPN